MMAWSIVWMCEAHTWLRKASIVLALWLQAASTSGLYFAAIKHVIVL